VLQYLYRVEVGGELWPSQLCSSLSHLYLGGRYGGRLARLGAAAVGQLLIHLPQVVSLGSYPGTADALVKVRSVSEREQLVEQKSRRPHCFWDEKKNALNWLRPAAVLLLVTALTAAGRVTALSSLHRCAIPNILSPADRGRNIYLYSPILHLSFLSCTNTWP
jgi:hypothetical protein